MSSLRKITKRSGTGTLRNSSKVLSAQQWSTISDNIASDIGDIVSEYTKIKSILDGLAKGIEDDISGLDSTFDAVQNGLDGTVEFTDRDASSSSPIYIWSSSLLRPLTIRESFDEIYSIFSEKIGDINLDLSDDDTISSYTKAYIGAKAFDSSLTSSATSMDGRIRALENVVLALGSETEDITAIKAFIGFDEDETLPVYSDHADTLVYVTDGDTLEKSIALLDVAIQDSASNTDSRNLTLDRDLVTPPVSPTIDDAYIVAGAGGSPTGAWIGHDKEIATWDGTAWTFEEPKRGGLSYVQDEERYFRYNNIFPTGIWVTNEVRIAFQKITAASFIYDVPSNTSKFTLTNKNDTNSDYGNFIVLYNNGVLDQDKVIALPTVANEFRIFENELTIFGDVTATLNVYKTYYPYI